VAAAGARLLDAPILGAPPLVAEGKAAVVVGGSESDVEIARPILENFGTVRHVGPLGRGARLKLVANSMLATVVLAAAELQAAGERAGLEPVEVFWVLERMAPVLGPRRHGFIENRHEPALFAVRDLYKDLDLATGLFADVGARTPLTGLARELFAAALASAPGMDITAVARPYREPTASTAAR
jgi:3-hydroxyisobutyrate dehydrogenase-like beta-hydroxyacid dehydrogenase